MKGAYTHSKYSIVSNVSEMGRLANEEKLGSFYIADDKISLLKCIRETERLTKSEINNTIIKAKKYANERNWENFAKRFIESLN